jgi:prepilin-type N-terminal cleavage/methylation domain-containing protein
MTTTNSKLAQPGGERLAAERASGLRVSRGIRAVGRGAGFTLMELMIAIGIMGVGLSMVMCLFPAALKEAGSSIQDTMGGMICKNAIAIAKAKLLHSSLSTIGTNLTDRTCGGTATPHGYINGQSSYPIEIGYANGSGSTFTAFSDSSTKNNKVWIKDQWKDWYVAIRDTTATGQGKIPANQIAKITSNDAVGNLTMDKTISGMAAGTPFEIVGTRGFLLLARQVVAGNNDYQLMAIAYQKESPANEVILYQLGTHVGTWVQDTPTAGTLRYNYPSGDNDYVTVGSPVIDPATGNYATIVSKDVGHSTFTLDREISLASTTVTSPFVVVEMDTHGTAQTNDDTPVGVRSPAISVLVTRTSLP